MKKSLFRLVLLIWFVSIPIDSAEAANRSPRDPRGGIFFYAKEGYDANTAAIANPNALGNWVQFYWSEIEKEKGRYDWSLIEARMKPWVTAGKKVAFRVYWIGSGYWRHPAARTATPQSVWDEGAKFVKHAGSGTEIPLPWDPVYQRRAFAFLIALAERYDANPNVLFFDVTPGAETNPYRFVAFNQRTPEFKNEYASTPASDGRKYSDELWLATVRGWIDATDRIFKQLPLVVTLNVGTLNLGDAHKDYSVEIGQYAVDHGFYVGQNGLHGESYIGDSGRKAAFLKWSKQTRLVFETLGDAGTSTAYGKKPLGTLREIIDAANRVNAHYLLPYPVDVLKGTKGQPNFDPEFADALAYGARTLGKGGAGKAEAAPQPPAPSVVTRTAAGRSDSTPGGRLRDTEPSWRMPPVEGANLHYKTFDSKAAGQQVSYLLYLPPGYEQAKEKRFPVVYWLHGIGGSQQGVPGITARITAAIEAGACPPMLMVFANGMIRSWYVDAPKGFQVESMIVRDLIPHIDATYRTIPEREGRMIEGFSMGGFGAAHLGFKYPNLFGSVSIIDGALLDLGTMKTRHAELFATVFGGSEIFFTAEHPHTLLERNASQIKNMVIRQTVGAIAGPNVAMHALLSKRGIAHDYDLFDVGHQVGALYEHLGAKNGDFYRRAFAQVANARVTAHRPNEPATKPVIDAALPTKSLPAKDAILKNLKLSGERWTYRDGEFEMSGILLKPGGKGPFPGVLISHGLGGAAQSFGMMKARDMVQWGCVCIAPNYTHNAQAAATQRAKGVRDLGSFGASAENLRRARTCVALLKAMPEVDGTRIAAYGHSMGGFVTVGLAASDPDLLKACAVTGSGVSPRDGYPAPSEAAAEKIRTPFLMLHGAEDSVVRPGQSEVLKRVLDKNKVPNDRLVMEGQNHPIDQTMRTEVFRLICEWFEKHGVLKQS